MYRALNSLIQLLPSALCSRVVVPKTSWALVVARLPPLTWGAPAQSWELQWAQWVAQPPRKYPSQTVRGMAKPEGGHQVFVTEDSSYFYHGAQLCWVYMSGVFHQSLAERAPFVPFHLPLFPSSTLFSSSSLLSSHLAPPASSDIIQFSLDQKFLFTTKFIPHIIFLVVISTPLPNKYKLYLLRFNCHYGGGIAGPKGLQRSLGLCRLPIEGKVTWVDITVLLVRLLCFWILEKVQHSLFDSQNNCTCWPWSSQDAHQARIAKMIDGTDASTSASPGLLKSIPSPLILYKLSPTVG